MNEDSETYKKSYPESFVRYFFRFVKSIGVKRGNKLSLAQVKRRIKKIPPAFIISAGVKRCLMHEITCPTEDCPYITMNKKIIMSRKLNQNA